MKIYLAEGMTVMNVKGRERELANKFDTWKRLFSFYFVFCITKSEILKIKHEDLLGSPPPTKLIRKYKQTFIELL